MTKLKLTRDISEFTQYLNDPTNQDFWLLNKFRHDFTNYENLLSGYNRNNDYMTLCYDFCVLVSENLPHSRFKKLTMDFYDKKSRVNS